MLQRLDEVFRDDIRQNFREQLIDLWDGKLFQQREVLNYSLDGAEIHFYMQFSVLPGHEKDWSLVQVMPSPTSLRARKPKPISNISASTDVFDQALQSLLYVDELHRLERKGPTPSPSLVQPISTA